MAKYTYPSAIRMIAGHRPMRALSRAAGLNDDFLKNVHDAMQNNAQISHVRLEKLHTLLPKLVEMLQKDELIPYAHVGKRVKPKAKVIPLTPRANDANALALIISNKIDRLERKIDLLLGGLGIDAKAV